jgi:L-amino acid N-acyltransferase YncA
VRIRLATAADAAAVRHVYAPYVEATAISFEQVPPTEAEMAERIAGHGDIHPWLVAEDRGSIIGYAYAGPFRSRDAYQWSVESSVYIAMSAQRRGTGRALYTALFDLLRAQGYRRALAGITLPNAASVGLHEAMGFTPAGVYRAVGWKLGAWHDVGWWQLDLTGGGTGDGAPRAPLGLAELPSGTVEYLLDASRGPGASPLQQHPRD